MMMKPHLLVALFLVTVGILHLIRLAFQIRVIIGATTVPLWISIFGFVVPVGLALLLLYEKSEQK